MTEPWPLSPLINYPHFPESSQLMSTSEQDFLNGNHGGDKSVLRSADLEFPDSEGLERAESRRPWADTTVQESNGPRFQSVFSSLTVALALLGGI